MLAAPGCLRPVDSSSEPIDEDLHDVELVGHEAERAVARHLPQDEAWRDFDVPQPDALWVEEFRWFTPNDPFPVMGPTRWSVFDPQGVWLGNVEVPPGFILRKVTGDRALGLVADELDVMEVFVYGLRRRVDGA